MAIQIQNDIVKLRKGEKYMKFNKLKMAVMGALMVPMMPVVAEEAASVWGVSGNVGLSCD